MPLPAATTSPESALVVLDAPIEPPGVYPSRTVAAEFVLAQLYETVLELDCEGHVRPGLARSWTQEAPGRWTIGLREGARFWSGDTVRASDVLAAWRAGGVFARELADSSSVVDEHTLAISLGSSPIEALADRSLSVYRIESDRIKSDRIKSDRIKSDSRPMSDSRTLSDFDWPEGSGPYRVASPGTAQRGTVLVLVPAFGRDGLPRLVVRTASGPAARDQLDAGADLLFSTDPSVLAYASARDEVVSWPLPWNRRYALLLSTPSASPGQPSDSVRASLARDAVRADAKGAEPPYWWLDARCAPPSPQRSVSTQSPRLVYRSDDAVARQLAERVIALAGMKGAASWTAPLDSRTRAVGLTPQDFATALSSAAATAFVVDLPAQPLEPCRQTEALAVAAPWLQNVGIIPLIDTRTHAIVRKGRLSFIVDSRGTLRVLPPSRDGGATNR